MILLSMEVLRLSVGFWRIGKVVMVFVCIEALRWGSWLVVG